MSIKFGVGNSIKEPSSIYAGINDSVREIKAVYVGNENNEAVKVWGKDRSIQITKNVYIAKSRGLSFAVEIPGNDTTCTCNSNSELIVSENIITMLDTGTIGSITPITVKGGNATYTVNIITAPDMSGGFYEIYNLNDLKTLNEIIVRTAINDVNQNAKLMNDIDLDMSRNNNNSFAG